MDGDVRLPFTVHEACTFLISKAHLLMLGSADVSSSMPRANIMATVVQACQDWKACQGMRFCSMHGHEVTVHLLRFAALALLIPRPSKDIRDDYAQHASRQSL